jgi:hypothetical protein
VGLIVNPIAGLGGRVGLKGTDGPLALERARELGAVPAAAERADRALARLALRRPDVSIVAANGAMGADIAAGHPFETAPLPQTVAEGSHHRGRYPRGGSRPAPARDRPRFVRRRRRTARDVIEVLGERTPVLRSRPGSRCAPGVLASTPEAAGEVAAAFVLGQRAWARAAGRCRRRRRGRRPRGHAVDEAFGAACVPDDPAPSPARREARRRGTRPLSTRSAR